VIAVPICKNNKLQFIVKQKFVVGKKMITAMQSGKTDCAISYKTVSSTAFRSKNKGDEAIREAIHLCVSVIHKTVTIG